MATRREPAPLDFRRAAEWRRWLKRNHDKSEGEWVYMYKKGAKRKWLGYPEALDEALCYGWIDGQVKAVDGERYRQRWTPRRKKSIWSVVNKRKVQKLTAEGRMAEPGLAAVRAAKRDGRWARKTLNRKQPEVPVVLEKALKADPVARKNFRAFAPSYRRIYIGWVMGAKQDVTRQRRVDAVVRRSRENRKPGMDSMYD